MKPEPDQRATGGLLSDALSHLANMVRGEVALAKAEVTQSIRAAAIGVGLVLIAVILAITSLNVLSAAAVAALVTAGLSPVWAALAVGLPVAVLAIILARQGLDALKPSGFVPSRTLRNLQRDAETLKEGMTHD